MRVLWSKHHPTPGTQLSATLLFLSNPWICIWIIFLPNTLRSQFHSCYQKDHTAYSYLLPIHNSMVGLCYYWSGRTHVPKKRQRSMKGGGKMLPCCSSSKLCCVKASKVGAWCCPFHLHGRWQQRWQAVSHHHGRLCGKFCLMMDPYSVWKRIWELAYMHR